MGHALKLVKRVQRLSYSWTSLLLVALLLVGCVGGKATARFKPDDQSVPAGETKYWTFDEDLVGGLPTGTESFNGDWISRTEADAPSAPNVLCQTGVASYPAIFLGDTIYANMVVSARFKPISGRTDQAAGIVFRAQDKDNYYILRANALEDNVNLYKYSGGRRSLIKEGPAMVASGKWQGLKVEAIGNSLRGFLNGQLVVEASDDTFEAGKVGLWTKEDSVTCFDDVMASAQASAAPVMD